MSLNDLEPQQEEEALLSKLTASQGQGGTMAKHCPGNWYTEHLLVAVPPCTSFCPLSTPVLSSGGTLSFLWRPRSIADADTLLRLGLYLAVPEAARGGSAWVPCHARHFCGHLPCEGQY